MNPVIDVSLVAYSSILTRNIIEQIKLKNKLNGTTITLLNLVINFIIIAVGSIVEATANGQVISYTLVKALIGSVLTVVFHEATKN